MTEKEAICETIQRLYEELCYEHDSALYGANDETDAEFRKNAEAERDELCRRIRNLKE